MTLTCKMRWLSLVTLCGAAVLIGCGPAAVPSGTVSGTVSLDGKPVESGEITFVSSEGFAATGQISGGQFKIEDALPVGKYSIGVAPPSLTEAPGEEGGDAAIPTSPVPTAYHVSGTSGLTQDIQQGANTATIDLQASGPVGGNPMEAAP